MILKDVLFWQKLLTKFDPPNYELNDLTDTTKYIAQTPVWSLASQAKNKLGNVELSKQAASNPRGLSLGQAGVKAAETTEGLRIVGEEMLGPNLPLLVGIGLNNLITIPVEPKIFGEFGL